MVVQKYTWLALLLGLGSFAASHAGINPYPPGLHPGDQYRLVFITNDRTTALSPDIGDYDDYVTAQANTSADLAALGTTWRVIGSTSSISAKDHTETDDSPSGLNGLPIYRLDGAIIADDYDDLWDGNIDNPLYVAPDGSVKNTCCGTWTGTSATGTAVTGYELGAGATVVDGAPNGTAANWVQTSPYSASEPQFLYAISGVLTMPDVPFPPGLHPGDQYRLVFITNDRTTALSPDIGNYDDYVTAQANTSADLAALGTTWRVIGSTSSVSAKDHTETDDSPSGLNGLPIYRLDGAIIADDYDDLWDGSIDNPLYVAPDGSVKNTCCGTWTGTSATGTAVTGYELGAGATVVDGAPNGTAANWVQTSPYSASEPQFLYAISGVLTVPDVTVEVIIDIKPGSDPNSINLKSKGRIPVAILTTDTFLAFNEVDPLSVEFGPDGATESHGRAHIKDVDDDGDMDMVLHFKTRKTGIQCSDIEATLTGMTFSGEAISGTDSIRIVKCR